jgi:circadian clock protein KaiB
MPRLMPSSGQRRFLRALAEHAQPHGGKSDANVTKSLLRLYIAGNSAASRRAERNFSLLRKFLTEAEWHIEIIDVVARPDLAEQASILATPTLCYEDQIRPRRIIGDLSDAKRVLEFLGIEPKKRDGT